MPLYTYIPSTNIPAKYQLTATFYISKTCTDKILMVFYYGKIKVKSRSIHDLAHLHPQPIFPAKNQLTTPNSLQDIPKQDFKGQGHYSKVKGQIKVTTGLCTLTSLSNLPAKYQLATLYSLHGMPGLDFRARSLHSIGKIQSHHDVAHLHSQPISLPSIDFLHQFQGYSVCDTAWTKFSKCLPSQPDVKGENNTETVLLIQAWTEHSINEWNINRK